MTLSSEDKPSERRMGLKKMRRRRTIANRRRAARRESPRLESAVDH
jgi:hypothetical protein